MILSIIIPVFNEERTIKELIEKVQKVKLPGVKKEIIVVDDCSTDSTKEVLKNIKSNFLYVKHNNNLGKGASIRTGLKKAKGDFVIIQDADLEYNPEDYIRLLQPILNKKTSIVYGTRLKNYPLKFWGDRKTVLPLNLLANHFLTGMVNLLYGSKLSDMETCYKLFNKKVIDQIDLKSNRFEIEPEITTKLIKKGYNIIEVPIKTRPRSYNEGKKIGFKDGIQALWTILKYRFTD